MVTQYSAIWIYIIIYPTSNCKCICTYFFVPMFCYKVYKNLWLENATLKTMNLTFYRYCNLLPFSSVQSLSPTLCDPKDCSMPGLPVHHQLPEFTQTHVHRVGDAIQPSHLLSSPSPPVLNLSQHQDLFK